MQDDPDRRLRSHSLSDVEAALQRTRRQLEQAERRCRVIADTFASKTAYLSSELRICLANQAFLRDFTQGQQAVEGRPLAEVIGQDNLQRLQPSFQRALAGQVARETVVLSMPDGRPSQRSAIVIRPEYGLNGNVEGLCLVAEDLSEHEADKDQQQTNEQRLSLALRAAGVGVFEWDIASGTIETTAQERELFGVPVDQTWHVDQFFETVHPQDRRRIRLALDAAIEGRRDYEAQFRIVGPGGEVRWIAGEAMVRRDEQGRAVTMIGTNWDVTAEVHSELELRLRERAINAIHSGIVIADANADDQPILFANPGFERMTGYSRSDIVGKNCRFLQGPETDPEAVEHIRSALRQRRECKVTLLNYRKDGSSFWNELRVTPVEDSQGEVSHFVGIQHDVTEQIQSERFLRRVLDSLFAFAGVCTPDGILVEANRTALDAAGLEPEDVLGKRFEETYWWSYDAAVQQQLREAIEQAAQGNPTRYDVQVRAANNQFITIDFQLVPMCDDSGRVTHLIPSAIDITDRLRDQERLTALGKMVQQSNDLIAICDLSGKGIFLNAAGRRLVGLDLDQPAEEINLRELFFADDWPKAIEVVRRVIAEGGACQEIRMRHRSSGQPIDVLWDVFRIDDPTSGQPFAMGTITQDIRQQKADRQRLVEARERADAANRSKTEFLANMSHEIRTPMTAILGFADLLGEQSQRPEDEHLIQTIQENGKHLLQIINDILDLSKIESGKLAIAPKAFSPAELVQEIGELMAVRADEKQLTLSLRVSPEVPLVIHSDPLRIKQILINLVGNALKFTDRGEVAVEVDVDRPASRLRFAVRDTGIGIDAASQKRLFEPFTQLDGSDTRSIGGTGLGLAISRRLAERLGGRLTLESRVGEGSTFSLMLDLPEPTGQEVTEEIKAATGTQLARQSAARDAQEEDDLPALDCRVLVVDDRPESRFLAQRMLGGAGAEVFLAETARQALQMIERAERERFPIDVVLTDIQMPQMDGYELARQLRKEGFDRAIIALTAHALQADLDRCIQAGCDAYTSKPLDRRHLLQLIAEHTT
ncbi:PAS domain S-box protein [Roseimaritima sediminicola]|uniref:PAS domain S-box protein n=1 Tax=Roseimaritima sediminicola TaxID=2662066 RepID=UPI00129839EF|nr:PAS domain S-box protein [Roseimaritima sediminicola]